MPQRFHRRKALSHAWVLALLCAGCGTLMTTEPEPGDLFDSPLDGLSQTELSAFVEGDEQFGKPFSSREGLGPIFNNSSCASCHSGDGRGRPENTLVRFSRGTDPIHAEGGPQLQDKAIAGAEVERLPAGVDVSHRLPPPVFGVGLLEAIRESDLLAVADPSDADGDGVSGRPNWVTPPDFVPAHEPGGGVQPRIGRFSRKAQVASLLHQVVGAYHEDMGITTDFLPVENRNPQSSASDAADRVSDPELPAHAVNAVVAYIRMLAPPSPGAPDERTERGRVVFTQVGCASCHVPSFVAGPSPVPSIQGRTVEAYTDLLLHDMGDELADYRGDGDADGREWKTAPLWGMRVMRDFLNGDMFLLHDGRARSVAEAIQYHGGEAALSRARVDSLSVADREALLEFVESR